MHRLGKEMLIIFSSGQMIPKCELLLRWPHADKPELCLEHEIKLIGAKGCSFFMLYIPDAGKILLVTSLSFRTIQCHVGLLHWDIPCLVS